MSVFGFICKCYSEITWVKDIDSCKFKGSGELTRDIVRKSGSYQSYVTIIIDEGIEELQESSFDGCSALRRLYFPSTLKWINGILLSGSPKFEGFVLNESNPYLSLDDQGILYDFNKSILICIPPFLASFTLPSSIKRVLPRPVSRDLNKFEFPNSVEDIDAVSLCCVSISNVTFAKGSKYKNIQDNSFWFGTFVEFHIPPSVESVGVKSFLKSGTRRLIFDDLMNSKLKVIKQSAFTEFKGTTIELPPSVERIESGAFESSPNLVSINIPKNCTFFSESALQGCPMVSDVRIDVGNKAYVLIDRCVYDFDQTTIFFSPPDIESFTIGVNLEKIATGLLQGKKKLKTLNVKDGNKVFNSTNGLLLSSDWSMLHAVCGGITNVICPHNVTKINSYFAANVNISSFEFENNSVINSISGFAFNKCKNLLEIKFPDSLTSIGESCFEGSGIQRVEISENSKLKSLSSSVFKSTKLMSFYFPSNFKTLGWYNFQYIPLKEITFAEDTKLVEITHENFVGCSMLDLVVIPRSVQIIATNAFIYCTNLKLEFAKDSLLETINSGAFQQCKSIDSLTFRSHLKTINNNAFCSCSSLRSIDFSLCTKLDSILGSAFSDCKLLESVTLPLKLETLDYSVFGGCTSLTSINAHSESEFLETYEGILYQKDFIKLLVCPAGRSVADVNQKSKRIESNAFKNCSLLSQVNFERPSKLEVLGENTFYGCVSLSELYLPDGISDISSGCFKECEKLSIVAIPARSNLATLGDSAFEGCEKLTEFRIGANSVLSSIGAKTFAGCRKLSAIIFPPSLTSIGRESFSGTGLTRVTIGGQIESIGPSSFEGCKELLSFDFDKECNISEVPDSMFRDCQKLMRLSLPQGLYRIGASSFEGSGLESVTLPSSIGFLGRNCFTDCSSLIRIRFCGFREPKYESDLPSGLVIEVPESFVGDSFCGAKIWKTLGSDCVPLPTGTRAFTDVISDQLSSRLFLMHSMLDREE